VIQFWESGEQWLARVRGAARGHHCERSAKLLCKLAKKRICVGGGGGLDRRANRIVEGEGLGESGKRKMEEVSEDGRNQTLALKEGANEVKKSSQRRE